MIINCEVQFRNNNHLISITIPSSNLFWLNKVEISFSNLSNIIYGTLKWIIDFTLNEMIFLFNKHNELGAAGT